MSDAQHEYDYPEVCVDTRKKGVRIVEREAVRGRQFPPAVADRAERLDEILRELEGMPEMLSASYVDGMEVKRSLYKDFSEVLARIGRLRDEYIVRKAPIEEVSDMVESVADQPQLSLSMASSLFDDTSVLKLIASRIRASIFFIGIGDAILTQQQSPLRCLSIMIRMYPYNAGAEPAGQDSARANDYRRYEQTVKSAFGYIRDTRDTLSTLCDKRLMNREGNGWREKQRLLQEHDKPIYPPKTAKSAIKELDGLGVAIKWILLTLNPEEFFPEPLTPTEHGDTSKKETADTSVLPPLVMVGGHPQPEQPTDKKKKKKGGGGIFPTRKKRSPSST
ncbi:MAG: hypothetical protein OXF02_06870 [Simkaniaceae bacterium]|nr:hypothetical protein [Simkaniaceae bacterium]